MKQDKPVEVKNLHLNQILVVLAVVSLLGSSIIGGLAWAKGWMSLPEKVTALEQTGQSNNVLLISLPIRVDALEKAQILMWQKRSDDHDLLLNISTSLKDLKAQSDETRQDVKDIHRVASENK